MSQAREGPIRAVVAGGGKQLFEQFADPRVQVLAAGEAAEADVDLIVVPCGTPQVLKLSAEALQPAPFWDQAARGRALVVFDASAEGRMHAPQRSEALHQLLRAKGVPAARAVYLTQERNYRDDYLAHCAGAGQGEPMNVLLHDFWIWRFVGQFLRTGKVILGERRTAFKARPPARERRFMSFNFTPRPTKALFLLSLMRDGLWDQGFISFGGFEQFERLHDRDLASFKRMMLRMPGFEDLAAELAPLLPQLDAYGQVMLGGVDRGPDGRFLDKSPLLDRKLPQFDQSWFTVVTETEMRAHRSRITEKPLKPLVNFQPMAVFGNPGALQMIRDLGFSTFGEVIDERYDDEPDPRRRFDMVYAEVRRLCSLDDAELARLEASIADKLEANARWGLMDMPRIRRAQQDAALIDRILALAPA